MKMWYLFAAYTITWALIFCYTIILGSREKQLQNELYILKKSMESKGL